MNDIIILGAGPGGYELAIEAAKEGLSVVLIEEKKLGGTCLNAGCIPTKAFHKNASILEELKHLSVYGIEANSNQPILHFNKVLERKNKIVEDLRKGIEFLLHKAKVKVVYGRGAFVDSNTVCVNEETYSAKHIVIATGSSAILLPGFEDCYTSTELLDTTSVPSKLVIIGGGVIGVEFATIFNAFGSHVEVVEYEDRLLPMAELEVSKRIQAFLKQQGIVVHTSAKATRKDKQFVYIESKGKELAIEYEQVLLAVGRTPNLSNIGLEQTGVQFTKKGITVNKFMQTSIPSIYAIGDVTGEWMLAHYATYAGYVALHHIFKKPTTIRLDLTPSCVFTFPEIAWIGKTSQELEQSGFQPKTLKSMYRANGKALAANETDGFLKILVVDNKIVGAHIIGYQASILIHEIAVMMKQNMGIDECMDIVHAHPTISEIIPMTLRSEN